MALTRNFLKSMGLTDEQVNAIIENHTETIEGLKSERDAYKLKADRADELDQQLTAANEKLANSGDAARVQQEFDDYKAAVEAEKITAKKQTAMRALLKDSVGIKREKALDLIMAAEKLDGYELGENDQFKDADNIIKAMKEKHADWIGEVQDKGIPPLNPPGGGGAGTGKTREEIMAIKDTARRQMEIFNNRHLFPEHFKN